MFARILEYRCYFNIDQPEKSRIELFGYKIILFRKVYPSLSNHLMPYFNEDNEIDGTQWNLKSFMIEMPKFLDGDYQFNCDVAHSGYKKYFLPSDLTKPFAILVESKLS